VGLALAAVPLGSGGDSTTSDDLDWLSAALDEGEPTIPDAIGQGRWPHIRLHDEDTGATIALDETADQSVDWELDL
jgi:hypothetical protein